MFISWERKLLKKQRVVLLKTTACFTENDVSFYCKQRVVLRKIITTFLKQTSMDFDCKLVLKKVSEKHSNLHQKCSQNCIRNVCKMVQKLCAKTVCKLCCKNCTFCVSKKVLQSDANEHFTYASSRARKQTNKQTNKQKHLSVLEKRDLEKTRKKRRILRSHSFPFLADAKTKSLSPFSSMSKKFFNDEQKTQPRRRRRKITKFATFRVKNLFISNSVRNFAM